VREGETFEARSVVLVWAAVEFVLLWADRVFFGERFRNFDERSNRLNSIVSLYRIAVMPGDRVTVFCEVQTMNIRRSVNALCSAMTPALNHQCQRIVRLAV
jgi:hypothetical protein